MEEKRNFDITITSEGILRAIKYLKNLHYSLYESDNCSNITLQDFIANFCLLSVNYPDNNKKKYYISALDLANKFNTHTGFNLSSNKAFPALMESFIASNPELMIEKKRSSNGYRYWGITFNVLVNY